MEADVVVVGAGPVGLMLASELALCGVRPVVVDKRAERSRLPKANGLGGRIIQLLEHRGLRETLAADAPYAGPVPEFPFGPVPLDFTGLDEGERLQMLLIQQPRLEELLEEHARGLGVEVRRGHRVTALTPSSDEVMLDLDGPDGACGIRGVHRRL